MLMMLMLMMMMLMVNFAFRLYGPRCGGCLETVSPRDLVRKAREKVDIGHPIIVPINIIAITIANANVPCLPHSATITITIAIE